MHLLDQACIRQFCSGLPARGLTKRYLYLTTNNIGPTRFAQMRRWAIEDIANCRIAPFDRFERPWTTVAVGPTGNQRVWVPAEGTNNLERMYWGQLDNTTTFRTYWWPESGTSVFTTTRSVATSNFSNPDCRGGVGNYDFIERGTSWSIAGFRLRSVVAAAANGGTGVFAAYWHSAPISGRPQAYIRAAVFIWQAKT